MKIKTESDKETEVYKDSPNQIKIKTIFEYDQLSFHSEQDLYCLANLTAPTFIQDEDHKRAPIDILCVIDKSGSMYGKKIEVTSPNF
jgi:cobalamin biosynthesis protein CobT